MTQAEYRTRSRALRAAYDGAVALWRLSGSESGRGRAMRESYDAAQRRLREEYERARSPLRVVK